MDLTIEPVWGRSTPRKVEDFPLQDWDRIPVRRYDMKKIIPALLLFLLCGCSTGYNYSPYVGQQENWSTQPGGFVKVVDGATLYAPGQLPNRPYVVIGDVTAHSEDGVSMNSMPTPR